MENPLYFLRYLIVGLLFHNIQAQPIPQVTNVAFTSGFTATYIRTSGDIPRSLQFATANAESVIKYIGAKAGLLRTRKVARPVRVTRR